MQGRIFRIHTSRAVPVHCYIILKTIAKLKRFRISLFNKKVFSSNFLQIHVSKSEPNSTIIYCNFIAQLQNA